MFSVMFYGFIITLSLIASIGAQSSFVLKQGLKKEYIGTIIIVCLISDSIFILSGIYGVGAIIQRYDIVKIILSWFGIIFLTGYGILNIRSAFKGGKSANITKDKKRISKKQAIMMSIAISSLNPHVYLDTLILIGSIASKYHPYENFFAIGSILSSLFFFLLLGYGSRLIAPLFKNPTSWRILDASVAIMMFYIAFRIYIDFL